MPESGNNGCTMSVEAMNYVLELEIFDDGTRLGVAQKLVAVILADAHNRHSRRAWPSIDLIARKAGVSKRQVQRILAEMEERGLVQRIRPTMPGRGQANSYNFPAIDSISELAPTQLTRVKAKVACPAAAELEPPKHDTNVTLLGERVTEGCHPRQERVTEGCHLRPPYKEEPGTVLTRNHEPPPKSDGPAPEFVAPEQYAQLVFEELSLVSDRGTFDVVSQALVILGKIESLPLNKSCDTMIERGRAAAAGGVNINRFWFTDRRFLDTRKQATAVLSPGEIMRRQLAQDGY
jgi:hypothetical protein